MKHIGTRLLSLLLALCLLAGLLPALSRPARAATEQSIENERTPEDARAQSQQLKDAETVYVSTWTALRLYLADTTSAYNIVLSGSISGREDVARKNMFEVNGVKSLDLNGFTIYYTNDRAVFSNLFCVTMDAYLEICDSSGGFGRINYDAYIHDGKAPIRNLVNVYGTLVVNGGQLDAGRAKSVKRWYTGPNQVFPRKHQVWAQVVGSAVIVQNGGQLFMNGGHLYGRGNRHYHINETEFYYSQAGIYVPNTGHVVISGGHVRGDAGAEALYYDEHYASLSNPLIHIPRFIYCTAARWKRSRNMNQTRIGRTATAMFTIRARRVFRITRRPDGSAGTIPKTVCPKTPRMKKARTDTITGGS